MIVRTEKNRLRSRLEHNVYHTNTWRYINTGSFNRGRKNKFLLWSDFTHITSPLSPTGLLKVPHKSGHCMVACHYRSDIIRKSGQYKDFFHLSRGSQLGQRCRRFSCTEHLRKKPDTYVSHKLCRRMKEKKKTSVLCLLQYFHCQLHSSRKRGK